MDSFAARLSATLQGATDTTFYIIAVYFGSVSIRKTRYAIKAGLLADLGGIIAGVIIATLFFGGEDKVVIQPQEMVISFTDNWQNNHPSKNTDFMAENCAFYDQAYDTIAHSNTAVIDELLAPDSLNQTDIEVMSIKKMGEAPNETVYAKLKRKINGENSFTTVSYAFQFDVGKIKAIQYLGNF